MFIKFVRFLVERLLLPESIDQIVMIQEQIEDLRKKESWYRRQSAIFEHRTYGKTGGTVGGLCAGQDAQYASLCEHMAQELYRERFKLQRALAA